MTGFGRATGEVFGRRCVVEVRSVNHRFLDLKLRLPSPWLDPVIEQLLQQTVRRRLDRGSVVLVVREEGFSAADPVVRIDAGLARAYGKALRELDHALGGTEHTASDDHPLLGLSPERMAPIFSLVAAQPGVLLSGEATLDPEARFQLLEPVVEQALSALLECRLREGEALANDLLLRLSILAALLLEVTRLTEGAPEQHRRRLEERLLRLVDSGSPIDPQRLAQEVALLADRLDVTEEVTRLHAHLAEFTRLCRGEALAGRRLDFLTQEINREINTIGSKSQSAEVAARIVAMKAELERLREQIQNVE